MRRRHQIKRTLRTYKREKMNPDPNGANQFDPWNPITIITDVVAGDIAGDGTPYKIAGSWSDKLSHQYTSWKCGSKKVFP